MTSQIISDSQINKVLQQIDQNCDQLQEEAKCVLKNAVDKSYSSSFRASEIQSIFREYLAVSDLSLRRNIIDVGLFASSKCLKEILTTIGRILDTCDFENFSSQIETELCDNLKLCLNILESLVLLLNFIIRNSTLGLESVHEMPKCVALIMLEIFSHCKNSETLYSTYFKQIGSDITAVFKKCHELQTLYFLCLTEHIEFDLTLDYHMDTLVEVLDIIVDIGDVVISLDIKTMAEEWKGYTRICEKYVDQLRDKYVHHKASVCLCREIQNTINSLVNNELTDRKNIMRLLKSSNFILKILIKISELYCGYISTELHHLVVLFSSIHQYSIAQLEHLGVHKDIIEGIRSHITVGAEPFLLNLLADSFFRQNYFKHIKSLVKDRNLTLGCLLFTSTIMRLLLQLDQGVRDTWTSNDETDNIVCCLFDILPLCNTEISNGLKFEGSTQNTSLYDQLLMHSAALSVSCNEIEVIERKLLMCVLQIDIWNALMAVDLWLIIARYGSAEFRWTQFKHLIKMYERLCKTGIIKDMPQNIYLSHLIKNLFVLLPSKMKLQLISDFPPSECWETWKAIGLGNIDDDQNTQLVLKELMHSTCSALKIFFDGNNSNRDDYKNVVKMLSLLSTIYSENCDFASQDKISELVLYITEAWERVTPSGGLDLVLNKKECSMQGSEWLNQFIISLCDVTSNFKHKLSNEQWIKVVNVLIQIVSSSQSCIKIAALNIIKSITYFDIAEDKFKSKLVTLISDLFRNLLEDDEGIVKVMSLEVFSYMASNTVNENILSETVCGRKELKEKITNFLLKKLNSENNTQYNNYNVEFSHKCEKLLSINSSPDFDLGNIDELFHDSGDEMVAPKKKMKIDDIEDSDIRNVIDRIKTDAGLVMQFHKDKKLNEHHYSQLNYVRDVFKSLKKS